MNAAARRLRRDAVLVAICVDCSGRVIAHANWRGARPMLWAAGPTAKHSRWWPLVGDSRPDGVAAWCPYGRHWFDLGAPGWSALPRARAERVTIPVDHTTATPVVRKDAHRLRPPRLGR